MEVLVEIVKIVLQIRVLFKKGSGLLINKMQFISCL